MKPTKRGLALKIVKAAELRAVGGTWADAAHELGMHPNTVRRWPTVYREFWDEAFAQAEKTLVKETCSESVFTLRQMLRDEDPALRRDAAKLLLHNNHEERKLELAADAQREAAISQTLKIAAALENIDDAQLDSFTANLLEELAAGKGSEPVGPSAEALPARPE
jgi:hypothetical protein